MYALDGIGIIACFPRKSGQSRVIDSAIISTSFRSAATAGEAEPGKCVRERKGLYLQGIEADKAKRNDVAMQRAPAEMIALPSVGVAHEVVASKPRVESKTSHSVSAAKCSPAAEPPETGGEYGAKPN